MDVFSSLPAFVLAVLLISASPGPAMALIFRRAALRGLRGAVPTVLGLEVGLYVWALFAGAGFAALVAAGVELALRDAIEPVALVALLALAGLNAATFHLITGRRIESWTIPTPLAARVAGGVSLALWAGVVTCGRWVGFTLR